MAKVEEDDRDPDASQYSSQTARKEILGHRIDDGDTLIHIGRVQMTGSMSTDPGSGRRVQKQKGGETISEDTRKLGFGEYAECAYVEVSTHKR